MTTLLQLILLVSVLISIAGGCGMEVHYTMGTALLLRLSWMVICWWRTFQQERDNRYLHRRLAYGALTVLLLSITQLTLNHLTTTHKNTDDETSASAVMAAPAPASVVPSTPIPRHHSPGQRSTRDTCRSTCYRSSLSPCKSSPVLDASVSLRPTDYLVE